MTPPEVTPERDAKQVNGNAPTGKGRPTPSRKQAQAAKGRPPKSSKQSGRPSSGKGQDGKSGKKKR